MAVLSNGTILTSLRKGELVESGDAALIGPCSYDFLAGKLFPTGTDDKNQARAVRDWTGPNVPPEESYLIKPGELIILRTRESVRLPNNVCGLWLQTDALSRDGLLLVNASMVPPGYGGPLTCTFVNFGKNSVPLTPTTKIAKLLFLTLDAAATNPSRAFTSVDTDRRIGKDAPEAPSTFLQISDRKKELDEHVEAVRKKQAELLKGDARNAVLRATPWALLVIVLLAGATWVSNRFLGNELEDAAKKRAELVEAQVEKELQTYGGVAAEKTVLARLAALEARLAPSPAPQHK